MPGSFFSTHRIVITPLSPIHIGCGEEYEPTNYVIDPDRHLLYSFDPSLAALTPEELRLLKISVNSGRIQTINKFYADHIESYRPWADSIAPIGSAALAFHRKMLTSARMTQLNIARTAYDHRNGVAQPYVPGSSLKGVIATALMNRLNHRQPMSTGINAKFKGGEIEEQLLGGSFARSPMRFVKVGDLHSGSSRASTYIYAAMRFFKQDASGDGGVTGCFEAVVQGQYRAFSGDFSLLGGMNLSADPVQHCYDSPQVMMRDIHAYALENWRKELSLCINDAALWAQSAAALLKAVEPEIKAGRAALVRLGKNAGAENKTLHGDNVAQICIHHKKSDPETLDHSTTAWLTNEKPKFVDEGQVANGLPFGWAILELDPAAENAALSRWCSNELKRSGFDEMFAAIAAEWHSVLKARPAALANRSAMIKARAKEEADRREKEAQEKRRAEALAALSPHERETEEICSRLEKERSPVSPWNGFGKEVVDFLKKAEGWTDAEEKKALANRIAPLLKKKDMYQGKAERMLKNSLRVLRGEA